METGFADRRLCKRAQEEKMRSPTVVLCVVWAATLLCGEMLAFWVPSLWTCSWPHLRHRSFTPTSSSSMSREKYPNDYVKVAVLADPQIMDRTSLNLAPKSLALEIAQFYTDLYMRRTIMASVLPFQPDVILFLGDYFDGGFILSDEEWQESLSRFKHIFNLNALERSANIKVYYIPGNHDVGYAAFHSRKPEVIQRYEKEFGSRNYRFTIGEVDFIAIDAQTIDGHSRGMLASATWDFVKNVSKDISLNPRVLLTHIPLYRLDQTSCGPHRSSPIINQRVTRVAQDQEILYQNYVTQEKSNYLLDMVRPVLILSGHDHDQCTVTHTSKYGQVREHTLGTISWQQGNLYPSFMLLSASKLSLDNVSSTEDAILTHLCFLPLQLHIYLWYLSLFALTILVVLLWPTNGICFTRHFGAFVGYIRSLISCNFFSGAMKEKNEDENCEYDMIWDAEGSMHLIKKTSNSPTKVSSEKGLVERGNAVLRPTARKQISQGTDDSVSVDVNEQVGLNAAKLPPKTNKSRTKIIIQRLVRAIRMLTIVAGVNFPLYVMLLFKDWIDK